jgi:hypothetical protein
MPRTVFASTANNQIIHEFLPDKIGVICGNIHDEVKYKYQIISHDKPIARLEINPITSTFYFTGTLTSDGSSKDGVYRFDTNRGDLSFFTSLPNALHLDLISAGNTTQVDGYNNQHFSDKCKTAPAQAPITLTARAERGLIYIHGIMMEKP